MERNRPDTGGSSLGLTSITSPFLGSWLVKPGLDPTLPILSEVIFV